MIDLEFMRFIPVGARDAVLRVLVALLALLLILLLRRVIMAIVVRPLLRGIQRVARRQPQENWLDRVHGMFNLPINLLITALGIWVATLILTPDRETSDFVVHLVRTFVIMAIFVGIYRLIDAVGISSEQVYRITGLNLDKQLIPFLTVGAKIILVALAVVVILQEWEYDVNGLIAGLGLGGLAFSLAAQETVANLFGFSVIVSDRPFVVGEYIITPDVEGIVEGIGPRSTRVRRLDQALVIVPNSKMANAAVTNWSRLAKRWINFTIGVTYGTDSGQMRTLTHRIHEMLTAREAVDPESVLVHFNGFGDSSLDILIRCYVNIANWGAWVAEQEQIFLAIIDIVDEMGLSIAFPSRSLYVENMALSMPDGRYEIDRSREGGPPEQLPDHAPNRQFPAGESEGESEGEER